MARIKPTDAINSKDIDMNGHVISNPELRDYSETKTSPSSTSGVLTLDISLGNVFLEYKQKIKL